jgi:formate C-acetyltransferase
MAGLPDVANSLYAIRKLVFEQKLVSLAELVRILKDDWKDAEALRLRFANSLKYYGNDNPEVDELLRQILHDCSAIVGEKARGNYIMVPVGVSTFGREIAFAEKRLATAFGKHAHEYLAPNLSPTPGTDKSPITAALNSYCRMDFSDTPNGCPLDLRLSAGIRKTAGAVECLVRLLRVFVEKNGLYLQIDTVDPDMLREAKKDPDRFPNLVVRISGWSARFASLSEEWQDMIINRTALEAL